MRFEVLVPDELLKLLLMIIMIMNHLRKLMNVMYLFNSKIIIWWIQQITITYLLLCSLQPTCRSQRLWYVIYWTPEKGFALDTIPGHLPILYVLLAVVPHHLLKQYTSHSPRSLLSSSPFRFSGKYADPLYRIVSRNSGRPGQISWKRAKSACSLCTCRRYYQMTALFPTW